MTSNSLAADRPAVTQAHWAGVVSVLGFVLLANANAVYSGRLLQTLHPFTFLFWAFTGTTLFYAALQLITQGPRAFSIDASSTTPLLWLNLSSAFNWIGYFFALRYLEPAIVAAIMCGFGPISVVVLDRMVRGRSLPSHAYLAACGTLLGVCFLVWASLAGVSGLRHGTRTEILIGVCAALAGGVSQAFTTIVIKALGDRAWTASQIMVHRFYLLILIALVLAWQGPGFATSSSNQLGPLALAVVFGVVVPLFLLQRGILLSDPFTTSVLLALGPVLTFLFQLFDERISLSAASAIGSFIVVAFVVFGIWMKSPRRARALGRSSG